MSNELTTYTPSPMVSLVEIRRDNVRFPRLHSYPQDIAHRMMTAIVIRANEYFGQKPEMAEVEQIAWDLYTELMNDDEGLRTRNITMEEIHRAIRKAATGQGATECNVEGAVLTDDFILIPELKLQKGESKTVIIK